MHKYFSVCQVSLVTNICNEGQFMEYGKANSTYFVLKILTPAFRGRTGKEGAPVSTDTRYNSGVNE